jgi:hypothetical protein
MKLMRSAHCETAKFRIDKLAQSSFPPRPISSCHLLRVNVRQKTDPKARDDAANDHHGEPIGESLNDAAQRKDASPPEQGSPPSKDVSHSACEDRSDKGANFEDRDHRR